jgi:hypothetical protein
MNGSDVFELVDAALRRRMSLLKAASIERFGRRLNFFITSGLFPSVSLTASSCALSCKHCEGKLLERLIPATDVASLVDVASRLRAQGAFGLLLTGGCDRRGRVPLEPFLPAIERIKEMGLLVIAHTGFVTVDEACALADAGIDGVGFDVVGDAGVAREVYGLDVTLQDYVDSLCALSDAGVDVFPHVCVGLNYGRLSGERRALELIRNITPATVVITALMPLSGTAMVGRRPAPVDVARVMCDAVELFPDVPVTLGCAHSVGRERGLIEMLAVECGVVNIAVPTNRLVEYVRAQGYEVAYFGTCCGLLARGETLVSPVELGGEWSYLSLRRRDG